MKIFLSSKADRQLHALPFKMYAVIFARVKSLGRDATPRGSKKLVSRAGWRLRVGDYRILYTIDRKRSELTVLSVAHRKDVYRS